jgi:ceramide glucosyltransferase
MRLSDITPMPDAMLIPALLLALMCLLHFGSIAAVMVRIGRPERSPRRHAPGVTVIQPVCGVDPFLRDTLQSTFDLRHRPLQIVFCLSSASDPARPVVEQLMRAHPDRDAHVLVGPCNLTANPKLNNMLKGWLRADHSWIAMIDSNVLAPPDMIDRMFAAWSEDTGMVCSPPVGTHPGNLWAEVECALLNTHQARWQLFADTLGMGFAQGKAMLVERGTLDREGGLVALGRELAEDAAATKLVRDSGRRVQVVRSPFAQPLGMRTIGQVWSRQVRWAKLRRTTFPLAFLPEALAGGLPPLILVALLAHRWDAQPMTALALFLLLWYGAEAALARRAGWPMGRRSMLAMPIRDALLPALWIKGWIGKEFEWRGNAMSVGTAAGDTPLASQKR